MANVLSAAKRSLIVSALVEGNSIRATVRLVGVSKNTVQELLLRGPDRAARPAGFKSTH